MKFSLVFLLILTQSNIASAKTTTIKFKGGKTLQVEVANSMTERYRGLMYRTTMAADHGMLFVFDDPQKLSFWNKNTFLSLSVAYLDENKVIKEIHEMEPQNMLEKSPQVKSYPSDCLCKYALEVNQGWFKRNKIETGQIANFPDLKK